MVAAVDELVGALRDPEHTGENRCRPCTVVNLVIAAVVAGGVVPVSASLGAGVFVVSVGVIYLRGYLVPGTPWLTQRFLPAPIRRLFGKPSQGATADRARLDLVDWPSFEETGVFGPDGTLTEEFRSAWRAGVQRLDAAANVTDELAAVLDVDPNTVTVTEYPDGVAVSVAGVGAARWPSRIAMLADLAAAKRLHADGPQLDGDIRELNRAFGGLRALLDRCPVCDGGLVTAELNAVACCGSSTTNVLVCEACDARIFEDDPDRAAPPQA